MKKRTKSWMSKLLPVTALLVSSLTAQGGTKDSGADEFEPKGKVHCFDPGIEATYDLRFTNVEVPETTVNVRLTMPFTPDRNPYFGECQASPGATEFAVDCKVAGAGETSFSIRLASPGDSSLRARVIMMAPNIRSTPFWLQCERE